MIGLNCSFYSTKSATFYERKHIKKLFHFCSDFFGLIFPFILEKSSFLSFFLQRFKIGVLLKMGSNLTKNMTNNAIECVADFLEPRGITKGQTKLVNIVMCLV